MKITTTYNGFFELEPDYITHCMPGITEVSEGLLIKKHYSSIVKTFRITDFMSRDLVYESVAYYWHEDEDLDTAPRLATVLDALEERINIFTYGAYNDLASIFAKGDTADHNDRERENSYKYLEEINSVWWEIYQLRDGRFYESRSVKYESRRGIPRISTVARRLTDRIIGLVWKMDSRVIYNLLPPASVHFPVRHIPTGTLSLPLIPDCTLY